MEVAKARLKQNKLGSDVPLHAITPAEALVLRAGFEIMAGGDPLSGVEVLRNVKIPPATELARLRSKYRDLRVRSGGEDVPVVQTLFPGVGNRLPETFEEVGIKAGKATKPARESYAPEPEAVGSALVFDPDTGELFPAEEVVA